MSLVPFKNIQCLNILRSQEFKSTTSPVVTDNTIEQCSVQNVAPPKVYSLASGTLTSKSPHCCTVSFLSQNKKQLPVRNHGNQNHQFLFRRETNYLLQNPNQSQNRPKPSNFMPFQFLQSEISILQLFSLNVC